MKKHIFSYKSFIHIFFTIYSLLCVLPFLLVVAISFSTESDVINNGFKFIPEHFTLDAYKQIFGAPETLIRAYGVTLFAAFCGTAFSVIIQAMIGYALSRDVCSFKKPVNIILLITMFFHGGLIPSYIINTQVLHLGDNILMYVLSGAVSAYMIFVYRTFFKGISVSLIESAQLDGATEMQMLFKIVIPLSKPIIATYSFTGILARWNDYAVPMYYMTEPRLYNLQYLLQQILNEASFLKQMKDLMPALAGSVEIPNETLKFAMCVLAAGPMVLLFPFFQKYFAKGMVVGSVKG